MRCELACSYAQTGAFQPAKSVIRVSSLEGHTSYSPYTCVQCAEGWCMTACPVDAITISAVAAKVVVEDQAVPPAVLMTKSRENLDISPRP